MSRGAFLKKASQAVVSFDRKGKCPICNKTFQSDDCPHSWDYVYRVMSAAQNDRFSKDVNRVKRRGKKGKPP